MEKYASSRLGQMRSEEVGGVAWRHPYRVWGDITPRDKIRAMMSFVLL